MSLVRAGALVVAVLFLAAVTIVQRLAPPLSQSQCPAQLATVEAERFAIEVTKTAKSGTPTPPVATSGLAVIASNQDLPLVYQLLTVRLPADDPHVAALLRYVPEALAERTYTRPSANAQTGPAVEMQPFLLEGLLRGSLNTDAALGVVRSLRELPTITIDGPVATITLVLPNDTIRGYVLYPPDPSTPVFQTIGDPWQAGATDGELTLRAAATAVPNGSRWDFDVCLEGLGVDAADPPPASSNGAGQMHWEFPPGEAFADGAAIEIQTEPNLATRLRLWLMSPPRRYLADAWNALVPMAPLLWALGLFFTHGAHKAAGWRGLREPLFVALIALIAYGCAATVAAMQLPMDPESWLVYLPVLVAAALVMPSTAALWLWSNQGPAWRHTLLVAMTVVNVTAGIALHLALFSLTTYSPLHSHVPVWFPEQASQLAVLIPLWVVGNIILGGALMATLLLPVGFYGRIPSPWRQALWWSGTILVAIAILAQWTWSTYLQIIDPWRQAAYTAPETWSEFPGRLQGEFDDFSSSFLVAFIDLLPLLGLVAIIGALAAVAVSPEARFLDQANGWVNRTLIFLFAAFVVGLDGNVLGYRVPLAFLFCLAFAWAAMHAGVAETLSGIVNGKAAALQQLFSREGRFELLRRAIPLDDPATPGKKQKPPAAGLPSSVDPKKLALSLGPLDTWWASGTLAVSWGALFALIPIGYYISVLASTEMDDVVSGSSVFGGASLTVAVLREVAFWLVAAFALGALFPYLRGRNGPLKAVTLALLFGAARGSAALLFNADDGNPWTIRFVQLFLFLVVLGVWLDVLTLRSYELPWIHLRTLYNLENTRNLIGYLSPLILALVYVIQSLRTGEAENAIIKIVDNLPSAIPKIQ